jgi:ribose 5-phosphate isomerase A
MALRDVLKGTGAGDDPAIQAVASRALDLIEDGATVGLGSGRAATAFVTLLARRVHAGLRVAGVPTSNATEKHARELGVPLIALDQSVELDLTVDGADEVAPNLDLVKGWGGALVRERIVAAASRRQVILVGAHKLVGALGEFGRIPVELIPFARGSAVRRLRALGLRPTLRTEHGGIRPVITDNGNLMLDCAPGEVLADGRAARALDAALRAIPGVVDTGLFLGTAERVLVGYPDGRVEVLRRTC